MAVHLKRLARKDPTTKLKALASLSDLLKQKSVKDIVPIVPQWAFEYKKLLLDYNREVRRVAFKLSKRKLDDNLQILHSILFGKQAKDKHRAKVKEKLDKCVKEKLVDFCDVLNIPISRGSVKKRNCLQSCWSSWSHLMLQLMFSLLIKSRKTKRERARQHQANLLQKHLLLTKTKHLCYAERIRHKLQYSFNAKF
ncbi:hypothetical protein QN277_011499 [Acacia crassicarpa]|uniref:E3 ubiquitin-protein ligase listerin n=1 Tax=Acacia crassicarpa TaxID=499986 RepID=A0AAE1MYQ0_9FABA|nr:hypothetical protein QN277_011499 [Acacia crassicarpa]